MNKFLFAVSGGTQRGGGGETRVVSVELIRGPKQREYYSPMIRFGEDRRIGGHDIDSEW